MKLGPAWWTVILASSLTACGPVQYRADPPRPPVCVVGSTVPEGTMDDYGTVYSEEANGPAASAPETHLVPSSEAGPDCMAPPWWLSPH